MEKIYKDMIKSAVIFGGGLKDSNTKEYLETIEIGKMLSHNGYDIKSGGYYGIMEAVSKGCSEANGHSIGYTCKSFKTTKGNKYLSETIECDNIYNRLENLIEGSDLFIVQRGSYGTLSELFLTLDIVRKMENKPTILLIGGFWNDIFKSIFQLVNENEVNLFTIIDDYKDIIKYV